MRGLPCPHSYYAIISGGYLQLGAAKIKQSFELSRANFVKSLDCNSVVAGVAFSVLKIINVNVTDF